MRLENEFISRVEIIVRTAAHRSRQSAKEHMKHEGRSEKQNLGNLVLRFVTCIPGR